LDVICLGEHWCKQEEITAINLEGYKLVSYYCRNGTVRGGSAIYVRDGLQVDVNSKFNFLAEDSIFEVCAADLLVNGTLFCVVSLYRTPSSSDTGFLHRLQELLCLCTNYKINLILGADFNINFLNTSKLITKNALDLFNCFNLSLGTREITRPSKNGGSCIDNFITSIHSEHWVCKVLNEHISDHFAVLMHFNVQIKLHNEVKGSMLKTRIINTSSISNCVNLLKYTTWFDIYLEKQSEDKYRTFLKEFLFIIDNVFHLKNIKVKNNSKNKVWFNSELTLMKEKCDKYFYLSKHTSNPDVLSKYKSLKIEYKTLLKKVKLEYNSNKIANSPNRIKAAWNLINSTFLKPSQRVLNNKNNGDNKNLTCNTFSNYFINSVTKVVSNVNSVSANAFTGFLINCNLQETKPCFQLKQFTVEQVHSAIFRLSNSNSYDIYNINSKILKICAHSICEVLQYIFNCCISEGHFPDNLKISKVVPIHKKGKSSLCENYRPVSLVPIQGIRIFDFLPTYKLF
jgi:hypothetical protein